MSVSVLFPDFGVVLAEVTIASDSPLAYRQVSTAIDRYSLEYNVVSGAARVAGDTGSSNCGSPTVAGIHCTEAVCGESLVKTVREVL